MVVADSTRADALGSIRFPVDELRGEFRSILVAPRAELCDAAGPVLFLGEWCIPVCQEASGLRYAILPNPWDDRERIAQAEAYCWDFCQRLFPGLAEHLNSLHGTNHSHRYWQVFLGSWLMHAVHVLYDRHLLLKNAQEIAQDGVVVVPHNARLKPPPDVLQAHNDSFDDQWNLACFAWLSELLGQPAHRVALDFTGRRQARESLWKIRLDRLRKSRFSDLPRSIEKTLGQIIFRRAAGDGQVLLAATYHHLPRDWAMMRLRTRGVVAVANIPWIPPSDVQEDHRRRHGLSTIRWESVKAENDFESRFVQLIASLLPQCFHETYEAVCAESRARYGEQPKHCVVDGNFMLGFNLPLLEYVARCTEAERSLWVVQNGGGYGYFRTRSEERLMVEMADGFLSWGWHEERANRNVVPLPSPLLSRVRDRHKGGRRIVLTEGVLPRYTYRLISCPIGSQFAVHREGSVRYVQALPPALRGELVYKRYDADYGWGPLPEPLARLPHEWPGIPYRASEWNRHARLAVVTYPDTTLIEALALNVPTIGFWNPDLWELRAGSEPYFDGLLRAGIVHHDAGSAAAKTAEVYDVARQWWATPAVQQARTAFLDRFGLASPNWRQDWCRFLAKLAGLADG